MRIKTVSAVETVFSSENDENNEIISWGVLRV
jgi:hypothetical protein